MPSSLSWLDTSAEAQRRAREMLNLFRQAESRDELGIGQIRDVFSDVLFPGTSVIQTRSRYFLLVPWLFQAGERDARLDGPRLQQWVHRKEREHIAHLREHSNDDGLIGKVAGPGVKILPSTIYWSGLSRYGILLRDVSSDQLRRIPPVRADRDAEASERPLSNWITLPDPPAGYPTTPPDGLAMRSEEAIWLRERIREAAPDSLLAHLLRFDQLPDAHNEGPWRDTACLSVGGDARAWLDHAGLFATALHGASLLFNLLIAERYRSAGLTRIEAPVDQYREDLANWWSDIAASHAQLATWDRADLWQRVLRINPRVSQLTRAFVEAWIGATRTVSSPDHESLRTLVAQRERRIKQSQSRLVNERLLRTWSGASGASILTFRWGQVRNMVDDIWTGMQEGVAPDALA